MHKEKNIIKIMTLLLIFLTISLSGTSCTTSVLRLKRDPGTYAGKKVRVSGIITDKRTVPLTDFQLYELLDDGFSVIVIREGNKKKDKGLYHYYCAKGDVYYPGSDDSRAKTSLQGAIRKKVAEATKGTFLSAGSDQIALAITELLKLTDTGGLQSYPPMVVVVED
jgi:hypothetical protein